MLSLDALIGSLKTHEIELNKGVEESNKIGKSIALKSIERKSNSFKAMKAIEEKEDSLMVIKMKKMKLFIWQKGYPKLGSGGRKRKVLYLKRTKKERSSRMKSFAFNAKSLDM